MEFVNENKICRLCLKNCQDGFTALNETVLTNLQSILPYLDIAITEEVILCEPCLEKINSYINFKTRSVLNQGSTSASRNGDDLRSKPEHDLGNSNSCRFCLKMVEPASQVSLENYEADMLRKYLPELSHDTPSPMCMACFEYLRCHFDFVTNCLQAEEDIVEYSNNEGTNDKGQIDLNDVVKFISIKCKDISGVVKVEEPMNNEINLDTKFEIKMENLNIKEEEDCNVNNETELIGQNSSQGTVPSSRRINNCKLCSDTATGRCDPKRHPGPKKLSEASLYECTKCVFKTKHKNYLTRHMIFHKMAKDVTINKCELCDYQSMRKSNLANHMKSHYGANITLLSCPLCQYQTKRKCYLDNHMRLHRRPTEVVMYRCPQCRYNTNDNDLFVLHMETHESQLESPMLKCTVCEFETTLRRSLIRHMLTHRAKWEVRTYKCGSCKFQTKYQRNLLRHAIVHKHRPEVPIFKCARCSFESKQQSKLYKHVSSHIAFPDEQMYGCGKSCLECSSNTDHTMDVHLFQMEVETSAGEL